MPLRAALAGVVAWLVVLGVACLTAPTVPTPEVPFAPPDRLAPATGEVGPVRRPIRVRVSGAGTQTVNLRAAPGTSSARSKGLVDGVELDLIGPDRTVDGMTWRNVRDATDGVEGWVSSDFLVPVDGSPTAPPLATPSR